MARVHVTALVLSVLFLFSCGGKGRLQSMPLLDDEAITGEYDLILYEEEVDGTRNAFAILDIEGDSYEFVPSAVEGGINRQRELPAAVALDRAGRFLAATETSPIKVRRILRDGVTIGFELRPRDDYFDPRPVPNLLQINYDVEGDKVRFSIRALPQLERTPGTGY
jgi:hypothetical protein